MVSDRATFSFARGKHPQFLTDSNYKHAVGIGRSAPSRRLPWLVAAFGAGILLGWGLAQSGSRTGERAAPAGERSEVLASVDGSPITVAEFEAEVARRGGAANFATSEARQTLLDEMVRLEVLTARARRAGYDTAPDVRADMKLLLAGRYRQSHLEPLLRDISVGDDEVEDAYYDRAERFTIPAAARAALLHFAYPPNASEELRQRVGERAATARSEALHQAGDDHFGAIAARFSDDQASRYRGGDLGWLLADQTSHRLPRVVVEAIFTLRPGSLSDLMETDEGLYLVRVLETRDAEMRPLAEVAQTIRQEIRARKSREATQRFHDEAARGLSIRVDQARLAAIELPDAAVVDTEPRPPALPRG